MPFSTRLILKTLAFGLVAIFVCVVALLVLGYAVFMVLWMHASQVMVAQAAGLLTLALLFGSLFSARASWRTLRASAEAYCFRTKLSRRLRSDSFRPRLD